MMAFQNIWSLYSEGLEKKLVMVVPNHGKEGIWSSAGIG